MLQKDSAMPSDRAADPWVGTTYNGFAGSGVAPGAAPRRNPPAPRLSRKLVIGGVGTAVALGLVLGIAARPNIGQHGLKPVPMQPVARPSSGTLDIEINKPVILPAPKAVGRLEVLPPDLAASVRPAAVAVPSARLDVRPVAPRIELAPPRQVANASFDCRAAGSAGERMVCGDAGLARTDRRLQRAYDRALASGAMPRRELREEQQDWLSIREQAARRSPEAVRSIYEQRIGELEALADDGELR